MELIVRRREAEARVRVERDGARFVVWVGERRYEVDERRTRGRARSLLIGPSQHDVAVHALRAGQYEVVSAHGVERVQVLDRLTHLAEQARGDSAAAGGGRICADMPGRVVERLVEEGAQVNAGTGVLVLEAMKMENEIRAARDGVIKRFFVTEGQAVEAGDPLYEIE